VDDAALVVHQFDAGAAGLRLKSAYRPMRTGMMIPQQSGLQ
jgi:hypothetical protein